MRAIGKENLSEHMLLEKLAIISPGYIYYKLVFALLSTRKNMAMCQIYEIKVQGCLPGLVFYTFLKWLIDFCSPHTHILIVY